MMVKLPLPIRQKRELDELIALSSPFSSAGHEVRIQLPFATQYENKKTNQDLKVEVHGPPRTPEFKRRKKEDRLRNQLDCYDRAGFASGSKRLSLPSAGTNLTSNSRKELPKYKSVHGSQTNKKNTPSKCRKLSRTKRQYWDPRANSHDYKSSLFDTFPVISKKTGIDHEMRKRMERRGSRYYSQRNFIDPYSAEAASARKRVAEGSQQANANDSSSKKISKTKSNQVPPGDSIPQIKRNGQQLCVSRKRSDPCNSSISVARKKSKCASQGNAALRKKQTYGQFEEEITQKEENFLDSASIGRRPLSSLCKARKSECRLFEGSSSESSSASSSCSSSGSSSGSDAVEDRPRFISAVPNLEPDKRLPSQKKRKHRQVENPTNTSKPVVLHPFSKQRLPTSQNKQNELKRLKQGQSISSREMPKRNCKNGSSSSQYSSSESSGESESGSSSGSSGYSDSE